MNEESLFKQSLLLTGKLVGVVAAWVAILSFVAVTVTSHLVGGLSSSGAAADSPEKSKTTNGDVAKTRNDPALSRLVKPNG